MRRQSACGIVLSVAVATSAALAADERFHCTSFTFEFGLTNARAMQIEKETAEAAPMSMPLDTPLRPPPIRTPRRRTIRPEGIPFLIPPLPATMATKAFGLFGRTTASSSSASDVDETILPYSATGKLTFDAADGSRRWCSATLIETAASAATESSYVITAAHCVRNRDNGTDHTRFAFVLGHDSTVPTGDLFDVLRVGTHQSWVSAPANFRQFDYAILMLSAPSSTFLPLTESGPGFSSWSSLGYPRPGDAMKRDDGTSGVTMNNVVEMLGNDMAHGTSGGPWIGALTENQLLPNEVIGINAAKTSATVTIGPVLVKDVFDLLDFVKDGCPEN